MKGMGMSSMAALMAMMGGGFGDVDGRLPRELRDKPTSQCKLPGCEERTSHNGGYCCGDHCREHDRIRRERK